MVSTVGRPRRIIWVDLKDRYVNEVSGEGIEELTRVGVRGHGPLISFFEGRCPRWRVTFEGAVWLTALALGMVAGRALGTPLDIAKNFSVVGLTSSISSSDAEGVGGKYSKWGESKSRARDAIE
jgi:hypothetical protein